MSIEVQSLAINALTKRIQEEAKVLPDGILRVADFLNYRVDPVLMDDCGAILANKLSSKKPTKVLAGCSSDLTGSCVCVRRFPYRSHRWS